MLSRIKNKNAFTLIEVLVVVSIISLLATTGVANLNDYGKRQGFLNTQQEIESLLARVYNMAKNPAKGETGYYLNYIPVEEGVNTLPRLQLKSTSGKVVDEVILSDRQSITLDPLSKAYFICLTPGHKCGYSDNPNEVEIELNEEYRPYFKLTDTSRVEEMSSSFLLRGRPVIAKWQEN